MVLDFRGPHNAVVLHRTAQRGGGGGVGAGALGGSSPHNPDPEFNSPPPLPRPLLIPLIPSFPPNCRWEGPIQQRFIQVEWCLFESAPSTFSLEGRMGSAGSVTPSPSPATRRGRGWGGGGIGIRIWIVRRASARPLRGELPSCSPTNGLPQGPQGFSAIFPPRNVCSRFKTWKSFPRHLEGFFFAELLTPDPHHVVCPFPVGPPPPPPALGDLRLSPPVLHALTEVARTIRAPGEGGGGGGRCHGAFRGRLGASRWADFRMAGGGLQPQKTSGLNTPPQRSRHSPFVFIPPLMYPGSFGAIPPRPGTLRVWVVLSFTSFDLACAFNLNPEA